MALKNPGYMGIPFGNAYQTGINCQWLFDPSPAQIALLPVDYNPKKVIIAPIIRGVGFGYYYQVRLPRT